MTAILCLGINGDRLQQSLSQLAEIGKLSGGGVSRGAFTPEDLQARELVKSWMVEAGMTVRWDAAGNMIGTYPGKKAELGAIATGSHIDTVPVGGRYDGVLGVLAGIEVVRTLKEQGIGLNHAIEVIVFTDEEVSVIGCKAMAGNVAQDDPASYQRSDGRSIQDCLAQIHGDWEAIATAVRQPGEIAAFVELHVEQGGVLENLQTEIGVVTGVVGQYRFAVQILGRANHAGTTPMTMRQDALVAAAQVVLAVHHLGMTPGDQVATVGYLAVTPNAANTVPSQVDLRIDLRDLSQSHLETLVNQLKADLEAIATDTGTKISLTQLLHILPTPAVPVIQSAIVQVCQDLGYSHTHLPSRAGHDAQEMGRFAPMGMIFVPSLGGISHSEAEYTSPEQCTQGANVLLQTFLRLDQIFL